jgi:hypothetical protein
MPDSALTLKVRAMVRLDDDSGIAIISLQYLEPIP